MPVPLTDMNSDVHSSIAGFIRFVDDPDSGGIRGALFLTSEAGKPLEFCFSRVAVDQSSAPGPINDAKIAAVVSLASRLFQATNRTPLAVFGLTDDLSAQIFTANIQTEIPLCRLSSSFTSTQSLNTLWTHTPPVPSSEAHQLCQALINRQDALQIFNRIDDGLAEAFDEMSGAFASVTTFVASIELDHIPATPYREAPPATNVPPAEHSTPRARSYPRASKANGPRTIRETRVLSLAERLRDLLAPPPEPSPPKLFPPEPSFPSLAGHLPGMAGRPDAISERRGSHSDWE